MKCTQEKNGLLHGRQFFHDMVRAGYAGVFGKQEKPKTWQQEGAGVDSCVCLLTVLKEARTSWMAAQESNQHTPSLPRMNH